MTNPNEAHAPYNFIPLPDKVAKAETLPDHDCYDTTRKSGYFDVTLTTETPLYIRGLITQQEASQRDEHKNKPDFFQYGGKPVIPGSSLRGMLRNLVEIIAFGKIAQVSGKPKIFFRAVAADKNDPLGEDYKRMVGQLGANVRAGYLEKKAGEWYVRPAKPYQGGKTFAKVRDLDPSGSISKEAPTLPNLIHLNDRDYKVQYHNVVITEPPLDTRGGLRCSVRSLRSGEKRSGVLVCTGNMAESSTADSRGKVRTGRRNFTFVFEADLDSNVKLIQIAPQAVKDYLEGLTPFQTEKPPFEADSGCLVEGRPIFYVTPTKAMGGMIHYFGHAPFFRVPATLTDASGKIRAVTPKDFIPSEIGTNLNHYDIAEAMFGYVGKGDKSDKKVKQGDKSRAYASRISVGAAQVVEGQTDFYEAAFSPKVLGGPKPTTFQHYLEQPNGKDTPKIQLYHYGNKAKIRGHKLYWRQEDVKVGDVRATEPIAPNDTQHTSMSPVRHGISFTFRVHFDNLSEVELGALAWALTLPASPEQRHQLGMGKPYGMGVVKLTAHLFLVDRVKRYTTLFSPNSWEEAVKEEPTTDYIKEFEQYICSAIGHRGKFRNIPRIKELVTMLQPRPKGAIFNYMQIEGAMGNEYKERPVLPKPSDLFQIEESGSTSDFEVGKRVSGKVVKKVNAGEDYQVKLDEKYGGKTINLKSDNQLHVAGSPTYLSVEPGNDQNNLGVTFKPISAKEARKYPD